MTFDHLPEQSAERGAFRDLNRLFAAPRDTLENTHKRYFHFNHRKPLLSLYLYKINFK